jgi:gliding motility-associated-like protein
VTNTLGTPNYRWEDLNGNIVGNTLNLLNVPKGRYRLRYKDQSPCDTLFSPYFFIDNVGDISIDETNTRIKAATCFGPDGSISGITVTGATSFNWLNTGTNTNAGTTLNISNLAAGNYQLTAGNNFGCTKTISVVVPQTAFTSAIAVNNVQYQHAYCDSASGNLRVLTFTNDNPAFFSFAWQDAAGNAVGNGLALNNIVPGDYHLIARDTNGCTKDIFTATLLSSKAPVIDAGAALVRNDTCTLRNGSIGNIIVNNGTQPLTYNWLNIANAVVGTQPALTSLGADSYRLRVKDALGCESTGPWLVVNDFSKRIAPPPYDTFVVIARNTRARLNAKQSSNGLYQLFEWPDINTPVQQNNSGSFTTQPLAQDKEFAIRIVQGSCIGELQRIYVKVADTTNIYVPTGFSPNGDKRNDVLKPIVIGPLTLTQFAVYNRWGQLVFFSKDATRGWDGTLNGAEQPAGTYVWMITGYDLYNRPIAMKGTTMLVR